MMKIEDIHTSDADARDFLIDGKLKVHIKRCAEGYSIDIMDRNGWSVGDGLVVWDEDLEDGDIP